MTKETFPRPGFNFLNLALGALLGVVLLGQLFTAIYCPRGTSVGMLVSLAGLVIGAGVGFLFAVPRVVQDANSTAAVRSSSSLEEVSDWIDKSLAQWFRFLLQQDQSSPDNDLASLKSEEQFKTWATA